MPKNTGRGSHAARRRRHLPTWIEDDPLAGRFLRAKTNGGDFERPRRLPKAL